MVVFHQRIDEAGWLGGTRTVVGDETVTRAVVIEAKRAFFDGPPVIVPGRHHVHFFDIVLADITHIHGACAGIERIAKRVAESPGVNFIAGAGGAAGRATHRFGIGERVGGRHTVLAVRRGGGGRVDAQYLTQHVTEILAVTVRTVARALVVAGPAITEGDIN